MGEPILFLDNAATSFPKPDSVIEAVVHFHRHVPASAGRGAYREAVLAGQMLDTLRATLCGLFNGTNPERVIFTLNGTDALNLAIKGSVRRGDHVVTTCLDHNSVLRPLARLEADGIVDVTRVPVSADGVVAVEAIEAAIRPNTRLIVMTHASNVSGTIQPAAAVGAIARARGVLFLLDAAQTMGSIPVDVQAMNVDLLAFPGHKAMMGPQGTGVLWVRPGVEIAPLREGGTGSRSDLAIQPDFLPDRFEPGAHNGPGLAGLLAAARFVAQTGIQRIAERKAAITERLVAGMLGIRGASILGRAPAAERVPIVSVRFADVDHAKLAAELDRLYDVKVRFGLHCAPLAHRAFGTAACGGAIRFSPGWFTTDAEIDRVLRAVHVLVAGAGASAP